TFTIRLPNGPGSQLETPGTYTYTLKATDGDAVLTASGALVHEREADESFPVGHTLIQGVDLWDGHVTQSTQDVFIPGRGLSLDFTRTYSSAGSSSSGPLGAGWTHSYNVRLVNDGSGHFEVIGGEGTGNTFSGPGSVDVAKATRFGIAATAKFYEPQVGYHSTLVKPNPANDKEFDFYTKAHVQYHFEQEPAADPAGGVYTLRFIKEPNGNEINLYYDSSDP